MREHKTLLKLLNKAYENGQANQNGRPNSDDSLAIKQTIESETTIELVRLREYPWTSLISSQPINKRADRE